MNISPGMRVAARRHKSFLRATTVALFCRTRPGGRAKKSATRRAFDTTVAANGVTRGENTVTRELRVEKRVGILHYSGIRALRPLNSPTFGQNRARCVRATS